MLDGLATGFGVALDPMNLLYVFVGVVVGTAIGVLPGLGPTATIALLLPLTYALDPATAIIMLAGIYYGSMYGGTITSVLLRMPGEAASVVTTFDGYQMAKQGRAGPALGIAAIGSFIGGIISVIGLAIFAPMLAEAALAFGPVAMVSLMVLGLLLVTSLGTGSTWKALVMAAVGLLLASVGQDQISGMPRFTFGSASLLDGFDFVAIAMGLFGVGEILHNLEQGGHLQKAAKKVLRIIPTRDDAKQSAMPILRGSVLGFFIGILPGGGGVLSSLASYALEKRVAKDPSRFGKGAIEGVAGPETANNASSTSAFVPLLVLGIPSNVVLALIFGALLIQGITPGPSLIPNHPEIFWGVVVSMLIGNAMLLVLNMPMVGVFVQLLRVPMGILVTFAMAIVLIGTFSIANDPFDIWLVLGFGVLGWLMKRTGFDPGPLVLAFVLGPILEASVRQSLLISGGNPAIFVQDPIAITIYSLLAIGIVYIAIRRFTKGRPAIFAKANPRNVPPATGMLELARARREAKANAKAGRADASADAGADADASAAADTNADPDAGPSQGERAEDARKQ